MLRLVLRNLLAHKTRSALTMCSMAFAVCLMCILQASLIGLESAVTNAAVNRLWIQSAVSLFVPLPMSYEAKIESVAGVEHACKFQWFGGIYQDESNFFAQFGIDPDSFQDCYPELEIVEGSYEAFAQNRRGCIIGEGLAEKYGFALGDTVPIIGTIFPRTGGGAWEFVVEAIYRPRTTAMDRVTMYFDFAYLEEALRAGDSRGAQGVGVFLAKLDDDADPTEAMGAIDGFFENGPQRVQTTTEAEFGRQFLSMLGNVPAMLAAVGGAVLFAIFFAVLNTMLAAGRERMRAVGILKAMGFRNGFVFSTLLVESLVLCTAGAAIGLGISIGLEGGLQSAFAGMIQSFEISSQVALGSLVIAIVIGTVAGIAPGRSAARVSTIQALRTQA